MDEIRSVSARLEERARPGKHTEPDARFGDPSPESREAGDDGPEFCEPARNPAWLALEILLITVLVFFWL